MTREPLDPVERVLYPPRSEHAPGCSHAILSVKPIEPAFLPPLCWPADDERVVEPRFKFKSKDRRGD